MHAAVGKVGAAEILAAISASIDAIGGAGEDEIGIVRVHEDGKCFDLAQRVFPVATLCGAAKHASETALLTGVITPDAGKYIGWIHRTVLRVRILRHDILPRAPGQCGESSLQAVAANRAPRGAAEKLRFAEDHVGMAKPAPYAAACDTGAAVTELAQRALSLLLTCSRYII